MSDEPPHPAPLHHPHKRGFLGGFRANFLTGLVVVLPIGLTIWLIWKIVGWIDGWVLPFIPYAWQPDTLLMRYLGYEPPVSVRGVGVIIFLVFTIVVGWIAKGLIGRSLIGWGEQLVGRMPLVRSVYSGVKQFAETVFSQGETKFDRACLVEYPRKGMWTIGLISTQAKGEIAEKIPAGDHILTVYVALSLIPPSGFVLFVPRRDIIMLERIGVEDAAKLIISAGLVYPAEKPALPPRT
jgi:uncharacterized membrane protein